MTNREVKEKILQLTCEEIRKRGHSDIFLRESKKFIEDTLGIKYNWAHKSYQWDFDSINFTELSDLIADLCERNIDI